MAEQKPIYTPPEGLRTNLDDFKDYINQKYNLNLTSYDDLHNFSITRLNDFWLSVWIFCNVKASKHPSKAIADDARTREVGPRHSSDETGEQSEQSPLRRHLRGWSQRCRWSKGRGPRGIRTSKARAGHRTG